jgi:hypothetical protein
MFIVFNYQRPIVIIYRTFVPTIIIRFSCGFPFRAAHTLCRAYQMCEGQYIAEMLQSLEVALWDSNWQNPSSTCKEPLGLTRPPIVAGIYLLYRASWPSQHSS